MNRIKACVSSEWVRVAGKFSFTAWLREKTKWFNPAEHKKCVAEILKLKEEYQITCGEKAEVDEQRERLIKRIAELEQSHFFIERQLGKFIYERERSYTKKRPGTLARIWMEEKPRYLSEPEWIAGANALASHIAITGGKNSEAASALLKTCDGKLFRDNRFKKRYGI